MAEIKLYLDEDISPEVAVVLRSRGYDAVSAHEIGMRAKKDEEQLEYATQNERVLITYNVRHFAQIAENFYHKRKDHLGIVVSKKIGLIGRRVPRCLPVGECVPERSGGFPAEPVKRSLYSVKVPRACPWVSMRNDKIN